MMQVFPADFAVTTFDTARPAVDRVKVGEYFEVETHDCYDGQVTGPDVLRPMIDMTRFNRAAAEEPISSSTPGRHGGNTDTRIITAGSEVLPGTARRRGTRPGRPARRTG